MTITLATLPTATAQEVFDQVAKHLLTQNARSYGRDPNGSPNCLYRGSGNLQCAAGCLIGDAEYSPDMEGEGWLSLKGEKVVPPEHCDLICSLQSIHDAHDVDKWPKSLATTATVYGLVFNAS